MVRNSLQKAVVVNFLLARNQFRTNYKATFLWDSSGSDDKICQNGNSCYGESTIKQSIKKSNCCEGLIKYRKCVDWILFICVDHEYQCFNNDITPGDGWEKYN